MKRLVLLMCVAGLVGCAETPHRIAVVFPDAAGLKPGDNVSIRGLAVGQVTAVDLHADGIVATVEIGREFTPHVDSGAVFRIDTEKMVTGKMRIVVVPGDPPGAPLPAGAEVRGMGPPPDPIEQAREALEKTVDHAEEKARGLGRSVLNPDDRPPVAMGDTIDLDRPGRYRLRLEKVKVRPTTADGSDWDTGSDPDVLAQGWVGDRQVLLTEAVEDTLEIEWLPEYATSELFDLGPQTTVRVKVLDADMSVNDPIGIIELRPTVEDAKSKRRFRLAAGRVAELALVVEEAPQAKVPKTATAPKKGQSTILD